MSDEKLSLGVIGSPVTFAGKAAAVLRNLHPMLGEPRYYGSGQAMTNALLTGEVDAIVGASGSIAGGHTTLSDTLMRADPKLYVICEKAIPFHCCLLAKEGARPGDIKVVYGGPASLPLAKAFVAGNMPQARCETYTSSTETVRSIIAGDGAEAMLGTRGAAELNGLAILAENIDGEAVSGNWWVISTKALLSPEPDTVFVSARFSDDGELGRFANGLATAGYWLSTVAARPSGARLLEFDQLIRFRGAGALADVEAVIDATANARLAGAISQSS